LLPPRLGTPLGVLSDVRFMKIVEGAAATEETGVRG
jgi:hypothetical protein